jgi:hypothetical protein
MMGGLIDGSTVKGDLWMIESSAGSLNCVQVATVSEGPGPRVGHASLLVGNAFIVFGGDTKIDENDSLDDTLYLLNTCKVYSHSSGKTASNHRAFSIAPMVPCHSSGLPPLWTLWTHIEHLGI